MQQYTLIPEKNVDDEARKVGVELKFLGTSLHEIAELVMTVFGGYVEPVNAHAIEVPTLLHGTFRVTLDKDYKQKPVYDIKQKRKRQGTTFLDGGTDSMMASLAVPTPIEIVTPPMDKKGLKLQEVLIHALHNVGAECKVATRQPHLELRMNVDIVSPTAAHLLAVMQSYAMLHDYLVDAIHQHAPAQAASYAAPYPETYTQLILQPTYRPTLEQLTKDYLTHNATCNRGLDMLPALASIDELKVRGALRQPIAFKARLAFHFRLPVCRIEQPGWGVADEFIWWQEIEYLAQHHDLRRQMAQAYLQSAKDPWSHFDQQEWKREVPQWMAH